jgi:glycosyltransferase involved in cell wall biosynthesis
VVPVGRSRSIADFRNLRLVFLVLLAVAKIIATSVRIKPADLHAHRRFHHSGTNRFDVSFDHDAPADRLDHRQHGIEEHGGRIDKHESDAAPQPLAAAIVLAPKFSIVTPSFNQRAYIEEALLSVKNQAYLKVEHIVIDGASTDGTVEVLRDYASRPGWGHLRWISEPDRGQSDALNKGFRMAVGEIVGWLNSDDRYRSECFRAVADAFEDNPQADVIYGDYTWIDQRGAVLKVRREIEFSPFVLLYHRVSPLPTPSSFFRRDIFDDSNFVDVNYHYAMDYEFFLRLAQKGYRFRHAAKILADFRWQPDSKSSKSSGKQFEERDSIIVRYSPLLRRVPQGSLRSIVLALLRSQAALLYWSRKLFHGYYFGSASSQNLIAATRPTRNSCTP